MTLQRWDPFGDLRRLENSMGSLLRGAGNTASGVEAWNIAMDVKETGDSLVIEASMPGLDPNEIDVTMDDQVLTIRGQRSEESEQKDGEYVLRERRSGTFHRSLRLPQTVDGGSAKSTYENGVLTVTLSKVAPATAKKIEVVAVK